MFLAAVSKASNQLSQAVSYSPAFSTQSACLAVARPRFSSAFAEAVSYADCSSASASSSGSFGTAPSAVSAVRLRL